MGLETIRNLSINEDNDYVIVRGVCKESDKQVAIRLQRQDYLDWKDGIPLGYLAGYLTRKEKQFLQTGIYK